MNPKRKSPFAGLKSLFNQYTLFTQSERKGIFLLTLLMVALLFVLLSVKFTEPATSIDVGKLNNAVAQYNALMDATVSKKSSVVVVATDTLKQRSDIQSLFKFNPNNLADSLWQKLGLSKKQINTIRNYESKGGKFYSKADVKKMYCISEDEYNKLQPYIDLPETKTSFKNDSTFKSIKKPENEKKPVQITPVEINIANEEDLITIPGIGPGRASAIIKYREKLGGYVDLDQVKEAYGMDSIFNSIKKYLLLEIYTTKRMNINTNSTSELKHPYITIALANSIINYRRAHGDYASINDLKSLALMDEVLYQKLAPYLKVK